MKKVILFAVLVGVAALATTGVALADHSPPDGPAVAPSFVAKVVANACAGGQKVEGEITSGVYSLKFDGFSGSINVTVVDTPAGKTFTFVTDHPSHVITSIMVKGGPDGANLYNYGASGIAHDDGLHSPFNSNSGKWYGLSHFCVFSDKK